MDIRFVFTVYIIDIDFFKYNIVNKTFIRNHSSYKYKNILS